MQVRLADRDGHRSDWTLDVAPGATVGDLVAAFDRAATSRGGGEHSGGAFVDGEWFDASVRLDATTLATGSEIRLAPGGWPGGSPKAGTLDAPTSPGLMLRSIAGPDTGRRVPLAETTVIGRDTDTTAIADPALSRRHLRMTIDPAGAALVDDLGSTNGTWVGGRRVTHAVAVAPGSELRAGATTLRLDHGHATLRRRTPPPAAHHRPPRPAADPEPAPLTPPATPAEPERPRLGVATLAVPLATGAVLTMIYGPRLAVLVIIGPLIALVGWLVARHSATRTARKAVREHQAALEAFTTATRAAATTEAARRRAAYPGLLDALERADRLDHRVWERRRHHHDFMVLVAGFGEQRWTCPTTSTPDAAAAAVIADAAPLHDVPETIDATGLVGIVGPRPLAVALGRSLAVQAAVLHGPADLRVHVLTTPAAADDWRWTRWLPHTLDVDGSTRRLATDPASANAAARDLAGGADDDGPLDWLIVDGDDEALARTGAIRALLADRDAPASGLVLAQNRHDLPATCTTVMVVDARGGLVVEHLAGPRRSTDARFTGCTVATAEGAALQLARRTDPELRSATGELPERCGLVPILGLDTHESMADSLRRRWARTAGTDELVVPIGVDDSGTVEIDLVRDGPHALVAGTTGSGKSELLRSLVASIAATADTEHVSLVLVDFKGGAAFDRLAALPHVVGSVTDLDDHLAARALRCLDAELRRREEQLRTVGASDITTYVRLRRTARELEPLPRLVVVVDEFATLIAELPEFVDSLVDLAQRGRSLGVHLVLATQRPAGAVKDSIRTNTNLRIALRVVESADSRDVLGTDTAARFPLRRPGRAAMRSGASAVTTFQAAQITGHRFDDPRDPVRARPWMLTGDVDDAAERDGSSSAHQTPEQPVTEDDLDLLLDAVERAHRDGGHRAARSPWPDTLPDVLYASHLGDPGAFALLDDPDHQRQVPLRWDPASGNLVIAGLPGSGVTTAIASLARSLAHDTEPGDRHLYAVTTDPQALAPLASLPHCGAVIAADDLERVVQLLRRLDRELRLRRRDHQTRSPAVVTLLDGVTTVRSELDDRGLLDELDLLERLAAEGPTVGLTFVFGAEHPTAVGHRLDRTATQRLLMRLPERADYIQAGLHGIDPHSLPPGRGFLATGAEVQVALPPPDAPASDRDSTRTLIGRARPWSIDALPHHVALDERFAAYAHTDGTLQLPVGLGGYAIGQVDLTLRPGDHVLITGPARSGKSTALASFASALSSAGDAARVVRIDGRRAPRPTGSAIRDLVLESLDDSTVTVVVIDDADLVDDTGGAFLGLLQSGDPRLHVVAAGRGDRLRGLFRHWTNEVRRSRLGLLLRGDELDGDLLGVTVPRRSPSPWVPGRGWLVHDDGIDLCQVACQPTLPLEGSRPATPEPTTDPTMEDEECA